MKEPKIPFPPFEWDFQEKIERITIWSDFEWIEDGGEFFDDCEEEPLQHGKPPLSSKQCSLQSIIDLIPKELSPKDIKIELFDDSSGMVAPHYRAVSFYYEKKIPGHPEELKAAKEKFKQDNEQYKVNKVLYDNWLKKQEIKNLEEKLKKLKK